ncbi:MAG: ATP-binding cassette domain-containing protein [Myxococcota bacterium]
MTALLNVKGLGLLTMEGRALFRDLHLSLGREQVAIIGRNGVGKSTLLAMLAGQLRPDEGHVESSVTPYLVPQHPSRHEASTLLEHWQARVLEDPQIDRRIEGLVHALGLSPLASITETEGLSGGELRKLHLLGAELAQPRLLLLDEPSEDLDDLGVQWLVRWLQSFEGGLLVASHDRRILRAFEHFFVVAESGCRYLAGPFDELERTLEREAEEQQRQYARNLSTLAAAERHHETVCRRRARKKNVGRLHELARCTPRSRLNGKRSYAQQSQARAAKIREARISAARGWAKATRRALAVTLPLELPTPEVGVGDGTPVIELRDVGLAIDGQPLCEGLNAELRRERVAVVGPNGAGKTSVLQVMLGERTPTTGAARCRRARIGSIAQGATDWMSDDSLVECLAAQRPEASLDAIARTLLLHRFPLALAQRPLRSLSPGERVRAALLCLFERGAEIESLVLDEPTHSLDIVGARALASALAAWPGGLVVASHDRELLEAIGIDRTITLESTHRSRAAAR